MPEEHPSPIHSPHDKFFKENFGRVEVARDFFHTYLPPDVVQAADWSTVQLEPGEFVDERLSVQSSDLLYSVRLGPDHMFLYLLFEHKSWLEAMTARLAEWSREPNSARQLQTFLLYLAQTDTKIARSTFWEIASRVTDNEIKAQVMTLAETLIQEGWQKGQQEGWQKGQQEGMVCGTTIGRIQAYQDLLGMPVSTAEALNLQETEALQELLRRLETQLRARWHNSPAS